MRASIETATPHNPNIDQFVEGLAGLNGFDTIILKEIGGIDVVAVAHMLKHRCDRQIFLKVSCRDRNRIALHSLFLTAASFGLRNVVLTDGMHPSQTPFPSSKPVYDLDALNLLHMLKDGVPGFGGEDAESGLASQAWNIGVHIGGSTGADMARAEKFAAAGADIYFITSLESVPPLRRITDKPLFLCVSGETADISHQRQHAESAGADGINVIIETPERVIDGSITAKQG